MQSSTFIAPSGGHKEGEKKKKVFKEISYLYECLFIQVQIR